MKDISNWVSALKRFEYLEPQKNLLIVELKTQENSHSVWIAQLLSYLRLANKRIGFIINFHVTLMKGGIKRIVLYININLSEPSSLW
jgi:hypothetical protein